MGIKDVLERMRGRGSTPSSSDGGPGEGADGPGSGRPARRRDDLTVRLRGSGVARPRSGPPPPRRPEEQTTEEMRVGPTPAAALERRTREEARFRRQGAGPPAPAGRPASVPAVLVGVSGELEGRLFPLRPGENRLGRATDGEVVLPSVRISREHALIVCEDGLFAIAPLSESNPTFVNEESTEGIELKDGDYLRLGDTLFHFRTVLVP